MTWRLMLIKCPSHHLLSTSYPAVTTFKPRSCISSTTTVSTTPASSTPFPPTSPPKNTTPGYRIPTQTTSIAPSGLEILPLSFSTRVQPTPDRLLRASIGRVQYRIFWSHFTSAMRSSGSLSFRATLIEQLCSACVFPESPSESLGWYWSVARE